MNESETILLIDLGGVVHRIWGGKPSQVDTYSKTLDRIESMAEEYKATIICADSLRNWRLAVDGSYKANRPKKPEELLLTIADIKTKLVELEFPVVECDNYEADDVIATLVGQSFDPVHILSEDKDLAQLVSDSVTMLTRYGAITPAVCLRRYGVKPEQMRDLLALAGDNADNVKGCPGIGITTAALLLRKFGSIEGIKLAGSVKLGRINGIGKAKVTALHDWDPEPAHTLVSLKTDAPASLQEQLQRCGVAA